MIQSVVRLPVRGASIASVMNSLSMNQSDARLPKSPGSTDLTGLWSILTRYAVSIAMLTIVSLLLAIFYLIVTPPTYQANTTLFIDPRPKKILTDDSSQAGVGTDLALLESQVSIIRSDAVLGRVVTAMALDQDVEFAPPSGGGIGARVRAMLRVATTPAPDPRTQAIASLANRVVVKRAQKTYVVEIEASSSSPVKAARIAQAIADAYLADQTTAKSDEAQRANTLIDARLGELRQQVRNAEIKIDEFRKANKILSSEGGTVGEQQLTRLNQELISASSQASEAKARLDEVTAAVKLGTYDTITDPAKTGLVQRLREQLAQVSRREAALSAQLLPKHPVLLDIRSQVAEVKAQIAAELKRVAATARAEFQVADAREREVARTLELAKTEVGRTNTAQIKLRELEQEAAASRELLRVFLARSKETEEQQKISAPDARMLSPPSVPTRPSKPIPSLVIALGLLGGLAAGVARALIGDHFDRRLRSSADVEASTGLPTLAELPELDAERLNPVWRARGRQQSIIDQSSLAPFAAAACGQGGPAGRDFRQGIVQLLNRIRGNASGKSPHVVLLVSANGGTGTTATTLSLAYAAASVADRVLLIDASADAGLSTMLDCPIPEDRAIKLDDKRDLASILTIDERSTLAILPIAQADLRSLDASQRGRLLKGLSSLAQGFDLVFIDGGAALEDASSHLVLTMAREVVLVARSGVTEPRTLSALAQHMDAARERVSGVVLTRNS